MNKATNKYFSQRVKNIKVSDIKLMPIIAQKYRNTISLGQGIPSLATPKYIRQGIIKLLKNNEQIGKYTLQPGLPALKQALAKKLSKNTKLRIDAEKEIFITTGGMEALAAAILSIVERDDEVIVFDPSYSPHLEQILLAEGKPKFVPLIEEKNWEIDFKKLTKVFTKKTKAIIICNPANPTGKVFSKKELAFIVNLAVKHDAFIIADETYDFLVYDGNIFISLLNFRKIKNKLIICKSFSKEFAMTGWRVGYLYAPNYIINQALKVHDALVICAPTISQYAALIALTKKPKKNAINIQEILKKRREIIYQCLDQLPDLFSYQKTSGAYYILAKYKKTNLNSWNFANKLLRDTGVITIPGSGFGKNGEGHIRFSFGGTEKEITKAFARIMKWNKKIK